MTYQHENPKLSCDECLQQVEAGERGPGTHRPYPCQQCPDVRFPPLDETSQETIAIYNSGVALSSGMGAVDWTFVFRLHRVRVPSLLAHEIVYRIGILQRIMAPKEPEAGSRQPPHRNGRER